MEINTNVISESVNRLEVNKNVKIYTIGNFEFFGEITDIGEDKITIKRDHVKVNNVHEFVEIPITHIIAVGMITH